MTQVLTLVALLALLSFGQTAPPPPDIEPQGPSLNGSPFQALGPNVRFVVEGVELPNDNAPSPNGAGSIWEPEQGPSLNGSSAFGIGGHQGSRLNGAPFQAPGTSVRGFAVEGVELPDGSSLSR